MANVSDYPAVGKILSVTDDAVVFQPLGTTYELYLTAAEKPQLAVGQRVQALIHVTARKIYTVPSGGNFIVPIFGPPKTIQGRIKYLSDTTIVVQAGTPIIVELPKKDTQYALADGPLTVGTMVNVVALPGATFSLAPQPVA